MSRSTERTARPRTTDRRRPTGRRPTTGSRPTTGTVDTAWTRHRAAGFTLLEVVVAIGILVLVTAAVVPQVIVGVRAAATARDISQAKGVAQARVEQVRNMPFYVGRAAGDYIDALDTYYRDLAPPTVTPSCGSYTLTSLPPTTWGGYVPASGTHCAWEPPGALYRRVVNPIVAPGLGAFSMTVATQFLNSATPPQPVTPPAAYDSQIAGRDAPPASQIGITVSVFFKTQSGVRLVSTYSQVERSNAIDPLIESAAKVSTLSASSASNSGVNLAAQVGVVNLAGELFTGSRVVTTATTGTGATSLGQQVNGAVANLVAPTDKNPTSVSNGGMVMSNNCDWMCFGGSRVDQASAYASNGLPTAGTATSPVRALFPDSTTADGFRFSNDYRGNRLRFSNSDPMISLDLTGPNNMVGVSNCVVTNSGNPTNFAFLTATGFLGATAAAAPSVSSCVTAQSNTIRLFPTEFAPRGIVRITLNRASAYCRTAGTGASMTRTAEASYEIRLRYWNGSSYTDTALLNETNPSDPLAGVNLNQSIATGLTLGDYISSWKSLTSADAMTSTTAREARVSMPGALTLITQPTREGVPSGIGPRATDPASAISMTIGALSCNAGDYR